MPESSLNKPYLQVEYHAHLQCLNITWKGRVLPEELESGYNEILTFLRKYPVSRVMLDLSQRDKIETSVGTQQLFGEIFTEALKVIKRPLFLAMVLSKEEFYLSSEASLFDKMLDMDNDYVITQLFSNCDEAKQWLLTAR